MTQKSCQFCHEAEVVDSEDLYQKAFLNSILKFSGKQFLVFYPIKRLWITASDRELTEVDINIFLM